AHGDVRGEMIEVLAVVVLPEVARIEVIVNGLEINRVLHRELLFELGRRNSLFQVFVRSLAIERTIDSFQRISCIAHRSELRRFLLPTALARIERSRTEAQAIPLEKFRILLL